MDKGTKNYVKNGGEKIGRKSVFLLFFQARTRRPVRGCDRPDSARNAPRRRNLSMNKVPAQVQEHPLLLLQETQGFLRLPGEVPHPPQQILLHAAKLRLVCDLRIVVNLLQVDFDALQPTREFPHRLLSGPNGSVNSSTWDTSSVENMRSMFNGADVFNQDIGVWNTSNVTDMSYMFYYASVFNQDIGNRNSGQLMEMNHMLYRTTIILQILFWYISSYISHYQTITE